MTTSPTVRVHQVWADNDKRDADRRVRVVEVDDTHAVVVRVDLRGRIDRRMPVRRTRIRLDRFRPTSTGYRLVSDAPATADDWNATHPVGTPVLAWPGTLDDTPMTTRTRTPAWTLGHGAPVVSVEGYGGGIALTHVEPIGRDGERP